MLFEKEREREKEFTISISAREFTALILLKEKRSTTHVYILHRSAEVEWRVRSVELERFTR